MFRDSKNDLKIWNNLIFHFHKKKNFFEKKFFEHFFSTIFFISGVLLIF